MEKKKKGELLVRTHTLVHVLGALIPSSSTDERRPNIRGMRFDVRQGNKLSMVTTNGHVLAVMEMDLDHEAPSGEWFVGLDSLKHILSIAKSVRKFATKKMPFFTSLYSGKTMDDDVWGGLGPKNTHTDPAFLFDFEKGSVRHALGTTPINMPHDEFPPSWRGLIPNWDKLKKTLPKTTTVTAFDAKYMDGALKAFSMLHDMGSAIGPVSIAVLSQGQREPLVVRSAAVKGYTHVIMPLRADGEDFLRP